MKWPAKYEFNIRARCITSSIAANYRRDVFETVGAAQAFETVLGETCVHHNWRIHGHVIMRNHYHLALETPGANLVEGMHWLQSTFAARLNRFRAVRGHLFQRRYQALLVENDNALRRVIDYINLNPVRAGTVGRAAVATFRWGSLRRFVRGSRPTWLDAHVSLAGLDLEDTSAGWASVKYLIALAGDPKRQQEMGFDRRCREWAIGTLGWRRALAGEFSALSLKPDLNGRNSGKLKRRGGVMS